MLFLHYFHQRISHLFTLPFIVFWYTCNTEYDDSECRGCSIMER